MHIGNKQTKKRNDKEIEYSLISWKRMNASYSEN